MTASRKLGKPRLTIVGSGDVGRRCVAQLATRFRVMAVTRGVENHAALRALGAVPMRADLDRPRTLARLAGLAPRVLHLAPPPGQGAGDPRTAALLAALSRVRRGARSPRWRSPGNILTERWWPPRRFAVPDAARPTQLIYVSTTGVYGDCGGALVSETRTPRPANARARRRVVAEGLLRRAGRRGSVRTTLIRVPGIYAGDRLPIARLMRGTPALLAADDVFTAHIHADDLARILIAALRRGQPQRIVHAVDDTRMKMADYFDCVADAQALPRPPRVSRAQAERVLEPTLLSFMRESRQLDNRRLKQELKVRLRYPTVDDFLASLPPPRR
ncbi:MAG: SDR family NAD(P)-dependent oxidoreductase [Janthinobacterium lividum]